MGDWKNVLGKLAPTVASAFLGPLGGAAVAAVGGLLGISDATQEKIAQAIEEGQLTPGQVAELKALEMEYQNSEKERGFKYAELEFKDRDSARQANVQGGVQLYLFILSIVLLLATLGCEIYVLFQGLPSDVPDIVVGRILGLMDAVTMMVLAYWYGSSTGSAQKTQMMSEGKSGK